MSVPIQVSGPRGLTVVQFLRTTIALLTPRSIAPAEGAAGMVPNSVEVEANRLDTGRGCQSPPAIARKIHTVR